MEGVGWTYTFARLVLTVPTWLLWRVRAIGVENVPKTGPLVLAPNHFSQMDHFFVGLFVAKCSSSTPREAAPAPKS